MSQRTGFIGRDAELASLDDQLDHVRRSGRGRMVVLRGRRQVGKSRLVEEFIRSSRTRAVFHTASRQSAADELDAFSELVAELPTTGGDLARTGAIASWGSALAIAADGATPEEPVIVVIDEFPYLTGSVPGIEAALQKQWDRHVERLPVLVILIGSDATIMDVLGDYDRPLYGRFAEMVVQPLTPKAISRMLDLAPTAAIDAYLVIGGFPRLAEIWGDAPDVRGFLERELANPQSPLVVVAERSLNAEFPADMKARSVLDAIGSGERAFSAIEARAGVSAATLKHALEGLRRKRVIDRLQPYSAERHSKLNRYVIADPYLRFWLRMIRPALAKIERGRGDLALADIERAWPAYAGQAVEPLIRTAIERMLPHARFGDAQHVGAYWNRASTLQVDLVGGAEEERTETVAFTGSIKWRESVPFGADDTHAARMAAAGVPGASAATRTVGVSRSGFVRSGLDVEIAPAQIIEAFRA